MLRIQRVGPVLLSTLPAVSLLTVDHWWLCSAGPHPCPLPAGFQQQPLFHDVLHALLAGTSPPSQCHAAFSPAPLPTVHEAAEELQPARYFCALGGGLCLSKGVETSEGLGTMLELGQGQAMHEDNAGLLQSCPVHMGSTNCSSFRTLSLHHTVVVAFYANRFMLGSYLLSRLSSVCLLQLRISSRRQARVCAAFNLSPRSSTLSIAKDTT